MNITATKLKNMSHSNPDQKNNPFRNPWKTLSSKSAFKNAWFRVREDRVIRPDGKEGEYAFLEKNAATGVVALTPANEVYLVGQWRYPMECYSWEIIEGGAEDGETPEEAARRELKEEAGLIAKRFIPLGGEIHLSNCVTSEKSYLFLAEDLVETEKSPDATEILVIKRVPLIECLELIKRGEIFDALTIIAIYQTATLINAR
jgi:8-oxo-dGTP pyrophosphatase MutT (NUDIX family)